MMFEEWRHLVCSAKVPGTTPLEGACHPVDGRGTGMSSPKIWLVNTKGRALMDGSEKNCKSVSVEGLPTLFLNRKETFSSVVKVVMVKKQRNWLDCKKKWPV